MTEPSASSLPLEALLEVRRLLGPDAQLYLVGGAVRDRVMQREVGDVDLATNLLPEEVLRRVKGHLRAIPTGLQHGTVTVVAQQQHFEITTFRSDGDYLDGRRPESVQLGVALEEDLARRDFTINAMALPVEALGSADWMDALVDPFGGRADVAKGLLRAVGDPLQRFAEDGLRTLRACRFAAQLDFEVEAATLAAIPLRLEVTRKVAVERAFVELTKLLCGQAPARGLRLLERTGLLDLWLPELRALVGCSQNHHHRYDAWEHTLHTFDWEPSRAVEMRWALLLHDAGKPGAKSIGPDGVVHFYRHELQSLPLVDIILQRLRTSKHLHAKVRALVALHGEYPDQTWSAAAFRRLLQRLDEAGVSVSEWQTLRLADQYGKGWAGSEEAPGGLSGAQWWQEKRAFWAWASERIEAARVPGLTVKGLALDGGALMELSQRPGGPWLGQLQKHLLDQVLEDPELNTPEGLTRLAEAWLGSES